jgi:hypothetical protein
VDIALHTRTGINGLFGIYIILILVAGVITVFLFSKYPMAPTYHGPGTSTPTAQAPVPPNPAAPQVAAVPQTQPSSPAPNPTATPIPTATPTLPPGTKVPTARANEINAFGTTKSFDGLEVSVSPPDFDSGCGGKMDFEVTLTNHTDKPLVLGVSLADFKVYGDDQKPLALTGALGVMTPRCYEGFRFETLQVNTSVKFAVRIMESVTKYTTLDFVFEHPLGRLSGRKWRLDVAKTPTVKRSHFGETLAANGLALTVGGEEYFPGCGGTLGFTIRIVNATDQTIALGLNAGQIKLYGSSQASLPISSRLGGTSMDCYFGFTPVETIKAGETIVIAVRNTTSLALLSFVDVVFETGGRLEGLRWRLNIPR